MKRAGIDPASVGCVLLSHLHGDHRQLVATWRQRHGPSLFPTLELASKVLQLAKEAVPHVSSVAILRDSTNPVHLRIDERVVAAGRELGMKPRLISVRAAMDLPGAFDAVLKQRAGALLVYPIPIDRARGRSIVEFALTNRLLAVTFWEGYVEQGFLLFTGLGCQTSIVALESMSIGF
jgi:hypothetical protein